MDTTRGNRLPTSVCRAFFRSIQTGSKWFELDMEEIKGDPDPKLTEAPGGGIRYKVPGVPMVKFEGKGWQRSDINYAASPYFFKNGSSGQLQIFITDPPADARKHVLDCILHIKPEEIFKHEGVQSLSITFEQNGRYWGEGDTIPSGAADAYATINPTSLPPLMPPATGGG